MTTWNPRANDLFLKAQELRCPGERQAYLDEACAGDAVLRDEVESLLEASARAGSFLESPARAPYLTATVDDPIRERPGTVIGPYKLMEQIGEGGMGLVFVAEQQHPVRRKVALKIIKPGMDTRHVVARFEAERQALALMDHPNIAKVLDGGETAGGRPYFVMELVKGVPITEYCDQNQVLIRQRLELFIDVCQAVQHAHQKGIIHRDLKPSNVLVMSQDGTPVVKVIDFGIAKAIGQQLTDKTIYTQFTQLIGTPLYMSPEQAGQSGVDVDTRSDIYALGVLLYELLTGTTPFDRERLRTADYDEIRRIIREEEPARPSTRISTLGQAATTVSTNRQSDPKQLSRLLRGELDWIVMKALEKDRNRRYETASAFTADVQRYLHDEPVQACPPSAWYRLGKFARRNKGRLAAVAGVFLAVTVMAASIGWAVGDHAARRATVAGRVRDSLNTARGLLADNKLAAARQKLAEASAQLANDRPALASLAAELAAAEADLDRFQQFLDLIDRAHEAETAPVLEAASAADGPHGSAARNRSPGMAGRRPAAAVPFLLRALDCYELLERDDWNNALEGGFLEKGQVEQIRLSAYEELLWLAEDVVTRRQEHRSGGQLSPQAAARHALVYLAKAESTRQPTRAYYALRARCHQALGEEAAFQADRQRADKIPLTLALEYHLLGLAAFRAKQSAEAIQAFETALRLDPTHYWSLMLLGFCLCDLGKGPEDFVGAARVFTGCILKRPDHAHAYYCRGNAYLKLGQLDKALADYTRAIALDPKNASPWYDRGLAYSKLGQLDKALADYTRAIELDPKNALPWNNRGYAYSKLRQPDKALADYTRAIALDPKESLPWNNRGNAYYELGQLDKAVADYSRLIALGPKNATAWGNRGLAYFELGQLDKALADYTRAIALDPKNAKAWNNRALAYSKLGQLDKALADYTRAIALGPKYALHWYNRGNAYLALGQPDKALADYTRAIELDPKYALPWNNRGYAYSKLGQPDKALANYTRAIELDPKYATAWGNRGNVYSDLGQQDKALADYTRAIELDPKESFTWNNRGLVYANLSQQDKALADYTRAIELDPKNAKAWYNRGNAYFKLGQLDKAIDAFREAIRLKEDYPGAHTYLGAILYEKGLLDEAITELRKALKNNFPESYVAHANLGLALKDKGRVDEAIDEFREAIRLQKNLPEAHVHNELGKVLSDKGQLHDAIAEYQQAIRLKKDYAEAHCNLGHTLVRQGHFQQAVEEFRRGHEIGSREPTWPYASGQWLGNAKHLAQLAPRLPGLLDGKTRSADPAERLALAYLASTRQLYATAARFYGETFAADPKRAEDLKGGCRFEAACAAARAGCGGGQDSRQLKSPERACLRRQALDWLRADLVAWAKLLAADKSKNAPAVQAQMRRWLRQPDFVGIHAAEALAKLPDTERKHWRMLWADVEKTLAQVRQENNRKEKSDQKK